MLDAVDQSTAAPDASTPATPAIVPVAAPVLDLAAITQSLGDTLGAKITERFSGFQSLLDTQLGPIRRELNTLKTAQLSPEEQAQAASDAATSDNQRLTAENAMLKAGQTQPEAVAFFQEIMSQPSLEAQLAMIQARLKPAPVVATPSQETPTGATAPAAVSLGIDANNPARKPTPSLAGWDGESPLSADQAAAVLGQFGDQRGALTVAREG